MNEDHEDFKLKDCNTSCKPVEIPTEDERVALDALRNLKNRVRELKKRLADLSAGGEGALPEKAALEMELDGLKSEWKAWEIKRDQAARERMIRLGHMEPD
jgi:hypothetical protein